MNKLEYEFLEDRRKDRQRELNYFYVSSIIFAIILQWNDFSLWWALLIIMTLSAILDISIRILNYLDLCSCLLEEQNEILKEKE